ncbi:MAG: DUF4244 domain-containing protein [Nocardioidaceae bacterium]
MKKLLARRGDERGMTTAEYAVGTIGSCGVASILIELAKSGLFNGLFTSIFHHVLDWLPF